MKLGIVGAGFAGEIIAYTAALRGLCDRISFVDINEKKAHAQAMDINDARSYYPHDLFADSCQYEDLRDADIIVLTSGGIPDSPDRLDEFKVNKNIMIDYTKRIVSAGFKGIFIVVSNPCDVMAYLVYKTSSFNPKRVIGAGTALDSSRLKTILSNKFDISAKSISAIVMGEHGENQFIPWSQVRIAGMPFERYIEMYKNSFKDFDKKKIEDEVRKRGWDIYLGKSCTQYGIANTITKIISAIINNENIALNVSTLLNGEYSLKNIYLSTPCSINKDGINKIFELDLSVSELKKLKEAANVLNAYNKLLD